MAADPPPPPPPPDLDGRGRQRESGLPRWSIWVLVAVVLALLFIPTTFFGANEGEEITYGEFLTALEDGQVAEAQYNNTNGHISGKLTSAENDLIEGTEFHTTGP